MHTKICTICSEVKPIDQFNKQAKGKYGKASWCRKCANINVKKWRKSNIEHKKAYCRAYEQTDKAKKRRKKYRDAHRDLYYQLGKRV